MIAKQDLHFLEEAKEHFLEWPESVTYRNEDETHIALKRYGSDIDIYRIEYKVARFIDQLEGDRKK